MSRVLWLLCCIVVSQSTTDNNSKPDHDQCHTDQQLTTQLDALQLQLNYIAQQQQQQQQQDRETLRLLSAITEQQQQQKQQQQQEKEQQQQKQQEQQKQSIIRLLANITEQQQQTLASVSEIINFLNVSVDQLMSKLNEGVCQNNILVQQRVDKSNFFNRTWCEFMAGFGETSGNYWLGNEQLHILTQNGKYKLRVELQSNTSGLWHWAEYDTFIVGNESTQYRLTVDGFKGNVSWDAMKPRYNVDCLNGMKFTTKDRDNDMYANGGNCALALGGGFWYNACTACMINVPGYNFRWLYLSGSKYDQYLQKSRMWLVCR